MAIPCRRPKVTVLNIGHTRSEKWDTFSAACHVPGCDWRYENIAKTDVEQTAVGHRTWHRTAVPDVIVTAESPHVVSCPCGQQVVKHTRTDADAWREYHLSAEHGLVSCG